MFWHVARILDARLKSERKTRLVVLIKAAEIKQADPFSGLPGMLWWRRGESNSGPYYILAEALQAYFAFGFKAVSVRELTLPTRIGSIFTKAIPITCFDAVP